MPFYEHNSENILFYKHIHTTLEYKATAFRGLKCFSMQNLKKNEKKISAQDSIQL